MKYLAFVAIVVLECITLSQVYAQQTSQTRWILQDSVLQQSIAREIIQRINRHLYNSNADVQLLREDANVSIIVSETWDSRAAVWNRSLMQIQAGAVIEDSNLSTLFDSTFIQRLLRRGEFFWNELPIRDPSSVTINAFTTPLSEIQQLKTLKEMFWTSPGDFSLSATSLFARIADRAGLFMDFGATDLGYPYPFWNSGMFKFGIAHEFIKVWLQSPLPGANASRFFSPRTLDAGFGAGAAFDAGALGGELTYSTLTHINGLAAVHPGMINYVTNAEQLYYIIPFPIRTFLPGALRMKLGAGLDQVLSGNIDSTGAIVPLNRGVFRGGPYLKAEFISAKDHDDVPAFAASIQFYNGSLLLYAGYFFTSWFGVEAQSSFVFTPDPWERSFVWTISPRVIF